MGDMDHSFSPKSPMTANGSFHSREVTPESSSSSHGLTMDQATSSSASVATSGQTEDMERFRKRMEIEQAMQTLQQRLKLASMKAENGWTDMSLNEIETKLPPPTPRREKSSASPVDHPLPHTLPYEPPSPSRPWQLIDVLWHPLPPPQRSSQPGSPVSPSSPRKRSREDDTFPLPPYYPSPSRLHNDSPHTRNTLSSHARRASASSGALHSPRTPNSHSRRSLSQSHAHRHSLPPTTQDVDAAKALTSMLESASPKSTAPPPTPAYPPLNDQSPARQKSLLSPVTTERSNSRSRTPQKDHSDIRRVTPPDRDEADTDAAELMMFLAHSPSPARTVHHSPSRSVGGAARVLFSESDTPNKVERHSNLALAPPITASDHRRLTGA